jgi:hypothetical protein
LKEIKALPSQMYRFMIIEIYHKDPLELVSNCLKLTRMNATACILAVKDRR